MKHEPIRMPHNAANPAHAYAMADDVERRVRQFMPLVQRTAWHVHSLASTDIEVDDLVQIGLMALTECAQRHASPSDDGFAAYAKMRVRGAMYDHVRKVLPDSRTIVKKRRLLMETRQRLSASLSREPGAAELAQELDWPAHEVIEIESSRTQLTSIEESYDEGNAAFVDQGPDPFEALACMDDRERVLEALTHLPERLQLVLQLFFVEELNLTEIAEVLEVSVPRVHQLRAQALKKMRSLVNGGGKLDT